MTDGILLAELAARPDALALRHADHRRGARAQPQHRLHPRLPHAAAAPPPRPQGDHHLGDDRHRALRRALRRRPVIEVTGRTYPVEVRYRPVVDPGRPRLGSGPRPGRRPSATRSPKLQREGPGDVLVFLPGEREIRDTADGAASRRTCRNTEILPLYARLSTAEQHRVFAPHHRAPDRAGHERRRDVADRARASATSSTPASARDLPLQPAAQGAAAADREGLAGSARTSAPAGAGGSRPASASASTPRTTSTPGRSSPSPRSCAPTSRR